VQGDQEEEERLVGTEPARAQRMVSESRDLVARTLDAIAQSRKLLDRLRRNPSRKRAPGDDLRAPRQASGPGPRSCRS
jgi:hypothetical protein